MRVDKRWLVVALLCSLSFLPAASAGLLPDVTAVAPPFGFPETALVGHTGYQLSIETDDGALITAVDITLTASTPIFHQRWIDVDFDGFSDPSPNGLAYDGRGDSHLTMISGGLVGRALTENKITAVGGLPDTFVPFVGGYDYGYGDLLSGAWGVPAALQSTSADLAYLVIPDGTESNLDFQITAATTTGIFTITLPYSVPLELLLEAEDASYDLRHGEPLDFTHQFTATGGWEPFMWNDLTLVNSPGPGNAASIDSSGLFSWDRRGAAAGEWVWTAQVTDQGFDSSTAWLHITVSVPEPGSAVLAGLAALGLVGLLRRR